MLAFRERAKADSVVFSSLDTVASAFRAAGVEITARGSCDAPEAPGLVTVFYELRLRDDRDLGAIS